MPYENILLQQPEVGIYVLTVNRPEVLNALNALTLAEIGDATADVARDTAARALIITGAGDKAFVAGADIAAMRDLNALQAREFSELAMRVSRFLEKLAIPSIAAVNGYCLGGGCELAMSCDWILASESAVFGQPEVNLGVIPGFGGTQRLTRLVGRGMAMEMVITARKVGAQEAKAIGLVNHVYASDRLLEEALAAARVIAAKGPLAVRLAKEAVQRGQDLDLENALVLEKELFALCFASDDQTEGMTAFLDKRPAAFSGH